MLIKDIARNSVYLLIPAAVISAFLPWEDLPFSILVGGLLGILNLKALAWSVEGTIGTPRPSMKMLFFGQFRLAALFLVIALLAYLRLISIIGLLAGFSIVFFQVLITGVKHGRKLR